MSSKAEHFLKKALGEDFMESLHKFELWKPGTKTTVDHEEIRTALQIVPRTIIALLIKELAPMAIEETKEVKLLVAGDALMRVTKHERDVYSGEIFQDNKRIVDFKFRSIPGVGLVIMSAFELYDQDNLINSPSHNRQVVTHDYSDKVGGMVQKLIDERLALHDLVNRVVENKLQQRDAVHNMILGRISEELEKAKFETGNARATADFAHERINSMRDGTMNEKPPEVIKAEDAPQKKRPLKEFLQKKQGKKEYSIEMMKGEQVACPDCGKNIFNGTAFSGCVCLGADMDRKVFIKKNEDGIKVRFSKGWDEENIEMLLEVLRKKRE